MAVSLFDPTLRIFRRLYAYATLIFVVVILFDANLSNLALEAINKAVAQAQFSGPEALTTGLHLLSNSILSQLTCVLLVLVSGIACAKFYRIVVDNAVPKNTFIASMMTLLACYLLYNTNALWHLTKLPLLESHFTKVTLYDQIAAIQQFNSIAAPFPGGAASGEVSDAHSLNLCTVNPYCVNRLSLYISILFYWVAYFVASSTAFVGVSASATIFAPLANGEAENYDGKLLQYRKRLDSLKTFLHFGSATLVVATVWMAQHAKWAVPLMTRENLDVTFFYNGFAVYMTLFYVIILVVGYLPALMHVRGKLYLMFQRWQGEQIPGDRPTETFESWLKTVGVQPEVLSIKDLGFIFAPAASLILSGLLGGDLSNLIAF